MTNKTDRSQRDHGPGPPQSATGHATRFLPATPDLWAGLEHLFGDRGACGGCWCMWFRLSKAEYEAGKGEVNRGRLQARIADEDAPPPGVLAVRGGRAVGWCAVAPRAEYHRLATTRTMRGPDDLDVWAILCLLVDAGERRRGLSVTLIEAACQHAFDHGAPAVEAYPIVPKRKDVPPVFASQGTLAAYLAAGFDVVGRPSQARAVVRCYRPSAPR